MDVLRFIILCLLGIGIWLYALATDKPKPVKSFKDSQEWKDYLERIERRDQIATLLQIRLDNHAKNRQARIKAAAQAHIAKKKQTRQSRLNQQR